MGSTILGFMTMYFSIANTSKLVYMFKMRSQLLDPNYISWTPTSYIGCNVTNILNAVIVPIVNDDTLLKSQIQNIKKLHSVYPMLYKLIIDLNSQN